MKLGEFMKMLADAVEKHKLPDDAEIYIDCYETLSIAPPSKDGGKVLIDVNNERVIEC
jgi:hypothetical protein